MLYVCWKCQEPKLSPDFCFLDSMDIVQNILLLIRDYIKRQVQIFQALIVNVVFFKSASYPTNIQTREFLTSGFFGKNSHFDITKIYQQLELSYKKLRKGDYFVGVDIMRNCLQSVYEFYSIDLLTWTPPFVSQNFTKRIGHRGHLGALLVAQRLGLISAQKRLATVSPNDIAQTKILFNNCSKELELIDTRKNSSILESPLDWHLSERLWLIKYNSDFIPGLEFTDRVFAEWNASTNPNYFSLNSQYQSEASDLLKSLGLPKDQPFISLHVRNKPWLNDVRSASIENYKMACDGLIKLGYFIVQFGTDEQKPVLNNKKLIIVQGKNTFAEYLTPYILANSKFFINTCSGPTYIAPLYGTPVLQTNSVAIGITTPTLSKGSIHLPKTWEYKKHKLSFSEILNSRFGYYEGSATDFHRSGYIELENSQEEIYNAAVEIHTNITNGVTNNIFINQINEIRETLKSPVRGEISNSFIELNRDWFLS